MVEVNVAVTLGLACERSRTKRSFWRRDVQFLEEVSYETLVFET